MITFAPAFRISETQPETFGATVVHYEEGVVGYLAEIDWRGYLAHDVPVDYAQRDVVAWSEKAGRRLSERARMAVLDYGDDRVLQRDEADALAITVLTWWDARHHDLADEWRAEARREWAHY